MSFSTDWLALREPFDSAARDAAGLDLGALATRPVRVLDLGCGTGANLRYLAPRLGGTQSWHLVDHDPQLLAALPRRMRDWAAGEGLAVHEVDGPGLRIDGPDWHAKLHWQRADLVRELDTLPFAGTQLVTASALLDLVSQPWLEALLARLHAAGCALLCALSVDGRLDWLPALDDDAQVLQRFAEHQRRDKGFGPALGADAVSMAVEGLQRLGYRCVQASSDWQIGGASSATMLAAMVDGLAHAALEHDPGARDLVQAWQRQRLQLAAQTTLRVGHLELLALPA